MEMRAVAPGPAVHGVPVGVMPADRAEDLIPWFEAMRHRGSEPTRRTAVLSMWKPFYLNWAQRLAVALSEGATCEQAVVETWFADDVPRDDLCERLATGPGLVFYVGHGRPGGWSGYKGLRWRYLDVVPAYRPVGGADLTDVQQPGSDT